MKILVMSDTHGDEEVIRQVLAANPFVDAVFHCGDSELDATNEVLDGIHIVAGNCDREGEFPEEKIVTVEGKTVFMTHGHLYRVKSTIMPLKYRAEEIGANIVLFGHSHLLGAETDEGTLFLNPGSLTLPRGRREKSYAIIQLLGDAYHVQFFLEEHILLEEAVL